MSTRPIVEMTLNSSTKQQLGIDHLLLQVHDACFPANPDEDVGRGSPYSYGAERLYQFAARLGFDGIQLGPQGMVGRDQLSPYEGTLFSRNPLNLPVKKLAESGRISKPLLESIQQHRFAEAEPPPLSLINDFFDRVISEILERASDSDRQQAQAFLKQHAEWLIPDAIYAALCQEYHTAWWGDWHKLSAAGEFDQRLFAPQPGEAARAKARLAELTEQYASQIEDYALIQWLLAEEHRQLRERLATWNMTLFADLQVGLAPQDLWARRSLFLTGYHLGAPPSRTNPDGQPWGFAVLDPRQFGTLDDPGPVLQLVEARLDRVLAECDGLRIDHPHGWVDPWVYRTADPDSLHAVQHGARLFSSPDAAEHPELQSWAIARPDQLNHQEAAYADHFVSHLDDAQVQQYARMVGVILKRLEAHGRAKTAVACEVLSTLPYPIQRVLERFHLGRFRVTSKLKLDDPVDVYRIEHAQPEDWVMLGTHDTATIWQYAHDWFQAGLATAWGNYLAQFLAEENQQADVAKQIAESPGKLVQALFTAMLASRSRNVSLFFPDLFGMTERYNHPGTVSDQNWRLRVPANFEELYESRRNEGTALDVVACLSQAREGGLRKAEG